MNLQKGKTRVKQKIYPFVNEIVDAFNNDSTNDLIEKVIDNDNDKSIFLMFVMMYYCIHLKLNTKDADIKKDILNELVKDPQKRRFCIEVFENKFQDIFTTVTSSKKQTITKTDRLFLENKDNDKINKENQ